VNDISDTRDAIMDAQQEVIVAIAEAKEKYTRPDRLLKLAIDTATMPEEGWGLVDDETKQGIVEVLHGQEG
jgi:hypothetical protein